MNLTIYKLPVAVAVLVMVMCASCKKEYVCYCYAPAKAPGPGAPEYNVSVKATSKKNAAIECAGRVSGTATYCSLSN